MSSFTAHPLREIGEEIRQTGRGLLQHQTWARLGSVLEDLAHDLDTVGYGGSEVGLIVGALFELGEDVVRHLQGKEKPAPTPAQVLEEDAEQDAETTKEAS